MMINCVPILVYGLEVYALDKMSLQSLDFTISLNFLNRVFMKLFKTSDIKIVLKDGHFLTLSYQVYCW